MSSESAKRVEEIVSQLRNDPSTYPVAQPHPRAAALTMPDGSPAPECIRAWAAFDERYPAPYSAHRGEVPIADARGQLLVITMQAAFEWVCVDSIRAEIEDDEATLEHVEQLAVELAERFPGYGVLLDRETQPDCILWLGPAGEATLLYYEHDEVDRREPFEEALRQQLVR